MNFSYVIVNTRTKRQAISDSLALRLELSLILIELYIFINYLGMVDQIYIRDNTPTFKGGSVQIVCEVSLFTSVLSVYKSDNRSNTTLNRCSSDGCISKYERYTFTASTTSVEIAISNLTRLEDEKWWSCAFGNQKKQLKIMVYSKLFCFFAILDCGLSFKPGRKKN